ncbi:MAG: class I SAM-dependent methyltransferase [Oscillibacter sp.]|nr:class I SAM-dependent methyltransferase [Oscillibacter sp.]
MNRYTALATSYDGLMADGDYARRAAFLAQELHKSTIPVHTVLDLACGTGTIACLLAREGFQVTATDLSVDMLAQAAKKAEDLENPPLFVHQAMNRLRLSWPVDGVVCTLDALNYITRERDLAEIFERVRKWLKPGGRFLFDLNTPYKLRRMDGQIYSDETENTFCIWRTFFSGKTEICTYQVDLFQQQANGLWRRGAEEHRERAWQEETIRDLLEKAGFKHVRLWGDLKRQRPRPEEDRWQFTAY